MSVPTTIAPLIEQQLPSTIGGFLHSAGEYAAAHQTRVFLVGGMVRDLLMGHASRDPDLLVQGEQPTLSDASNLASALAKAWDGEVISISRFGTAKLAVKEFVADLSTARMETYSVPGALPDVTPATIEDDIGRRDFTINTMAVDLSPRGFGNLLDFYSASDDLQTGTLRIIHDRSFQDDPTRLLRAARYESRLGLHMAPQTEAAARRAAEYLKVVSGDRIRHELERMFEEVKPEVVLNRAEELSLFHSLVPTMEWSPQMAEAVVSIRTAGYGSSPLLPLALLATSLDQNTLEAFIDRLNAPLTWAAVIRDTYTLKKRLLSISTAETLRPSTLYAKVFDLAPEVILGWGVVAPDQETRNLLINFHTKWRYVKPLLTGDDLLALNVPQGPQVGELLKELLYARLDGFVLTREAEERFVRSHL